MNKSDKSTLIVQLSGGLGNQLFEYVAGLWFAQRNDLQLKVDLSQLENNNQSHGLTLKSAGLAAEYCNLVEELSLPGYFLHRGVVSPRESSPSWLEDFRHSPRSIHLQGLAMIHSWRC